MKKKKFLLLLGGGFLLFGTVMNIVNALNNYGMATNSLHSEMWAQLNGDPNDDGNQPGNGDNTGGGNTTGGDNTGGGDTTGGGTTTGGSNPNPPTPPTPPAPGIISNAHMFIGKPYEKEITADSGGKLYVNGHPFDGTYTAGVTYNTTVEDHRCVKDTSNDSCDSNKEGTYPVNVGKPVNN